MYATVPSIMPSAVSRDRSRATASPKSPSSSAAVLVEPDVARFHIPVDDAAAVRVLERVRDLAADPHRVFQGQPAAVRGRR